MTKKDIESHRTGILIVLIIAIHAICIVYYFLGLRLIPEESARSAFGDYFGALNTLFSGLAFAVIVLTVILQMREMKNQRTELKFSRQEQRLSRKELHIQGEELKLHRNELKNQSREFTNQRREFQISRTTNIIYSQIELCNDSISSITITKENGVRENGKDAIHWILDKLENIQYTRKRITKNSDYDFSKIPEKIDLIRQLSPEISRYTDTVYNSCQVIQLVLSNEDILVEDLNELRSIFFANLGKDVDYFFMKTQIVIEFSELRTELELLFKQIKDINSYQKFRYDMVVKN